MTLDELRDYMHAANPSVTEKQIATFFNKLDKDGNKKVRKALKGTDTLGALQGLKHALTRSSRP